MSKDAPQSADPTAPAVEPEHERAVDLANRVLERPNADPDDDLAVLARQFLRARENAVAWHRACDTAGVLLELPGAGYSPREFLAFVQEKDAIARHDANEAADRLASLARELESVKADAERYQHAKSLTEWRSLGRFHSLKMPEIHWPQSERGGSAADQLDKAIDAARALPAPPEEKR